ncbi:MAG: hypothetical protein FWE67_11380 [Planctomycetaceae bacterium]|nr:hypothetical protein [Planctomycetaceae bacterium]
MLRFIFSLVVVFAAIAAVTVSTVAYAKSPVTPGASEADIKNRNTVAYPVWQLQKDWMYQDLASTEDRTVVDNPAGIVLPDLTKCFADADANDIEAGMIRRVLNELKRRSIPTDEHEKTLTGFLETKKPGNAPAWKEFYFGLCELRRKARLSAAFAGQVRQYVYTKHHVIGQSQAMFMHTTHLSDADFRERGPDYQMGAELCLMTISDDGTVSTEILYDCPAGMLRDPCVSFDGKRIAFSMRRNDVDDDFHIYVMEVADRSVRQITFGAGTADLEPCYLPSGDIIFESTRGVQSAPCWWSNVTNLYTCDGEGRFVRRLSYDHAHSCYPSVLPDGRISYTRWEYADRNAGALQPAMVMNADGTNQTEYYGNNSLIPTGLTHIRGIPGTQKAVGIMVGHHVPQHGKLVMIDRTKGTQENQGIKYICPEIPMPKPDVDPYEWTPQGANTLGCSGDQYQYPWALDERNYLVSYLPVPPFRPASYVPRGPYPTKFGIYWMENSGEVKPALITDKRTKPPRNYYMGTIGERELLIYDPTISSGQVFPLAAREIPPVRPTQVDQSKSYGTFYVQDVYHGPAMEGVERGAVKKLRVVGLDGRSASTTQVLLHPAGGRSTTAIAVNNGSYDVKHVLGTVDVEDDGSVLFNVPARTPVYFQLLDEKGYAVQTMRSWTILQPGETLSCVGCHEDKNTSFIGNTLVTKAIRKLPRKLTPFFKPEEEPVQEQLEFFTELERRAWEYLGVNAPQGEDVPRGFSYRREIQPIWDAHCICCHAGTKNPDKADVPLSLLGDSGTYDINVLVKNAVWRDVYRNITAANAQNTQTPGLGRDLSESYIGLTKYGFLTKYSSLYANKDVDEDIVKNILVDFPHACGHAEMNPPYHEGAAKSKLMQYLETSHYGVQVSQEEKERIACWIDLLVPYCGSWMEANTWDACRNHLYHRNGDQLRGVYLFNEAKRLRHAMVEVVHLDKYKEHLATGKTFSLDEFPQMEFGGWDVQRTFLEQFKVKNEQVPIHGIAEGLNSRGGSTVAGNPVRNLALNPFAATHQIRCYPHAASNSHHKYRAEFSPKNLIDGDKSSGGTCWHPDPRTDLWVQVDFGREVSVEKTVLYLKVFPDSKKTWTSATLVFSDGSKIPITLRHTAEEQEFDVPVRKTRFVKLEDLKETFPLSQNGIVEWEIFGRD